MEPTNRKIQALIDMYLNRELLLPEMQRKYVWKQTQLRDLIDSVYRDYPSGSILIWETDTPPLTKTPAVEKKEQQPIGKQLLLLDGQQRITSLASVITGLPIRIKEGTAVKEKFVDVYFNLDHPEEISKSVEESPRFEVGDVVDAKWEDEEFYPGKISQINGNRFYIVYDDDSEGWTDEVRLLSEESKKNLCFQIKNRIIENKPNWISVTKLFKDGVGSILRQLKIGADDTNFDKYNRRLNQLYNRKDSYLYPIQIIRDKSYNEVTDIFIRVNSSGTRLRASDLALAQITSIWSGSAKIFEEFVDNCIQQHFYFDENYLVRCLISIATGQSKFDNISRIPLEQLKVSWELTKKGISNTINFLKNNAFVDCSTVLPSQILLIPLVYYSSRKNLCGSSQTEKGFLYWFYNAAIWGRYSGSMETSLNEDLSVLSKREPYLYLIENIWKSVGKERKTGAEDIRGKGTNNPYFFMMYVLARKNRARDLETGDIISYDNFGDNNKIEHDHIFPKSKLDRFFQNMLETSQRKKVINEISNMAFMTKKGNIIKKDEDPKIYFPRVNKTYGDNVFKQQQIPFKEELLTYDKYDDFLSERAKRLANNINRFLEDFKPK
ncbi:DUF262 domain-containing protein [Chloroflexota bacterium]